MVVKVCWSLVYIYPSLPVLAFLPHLFLPLFPFCAMRHCVRSAPLPVAPCPGIFLEQSGATDPFFPVTTNQQYVNQGGSRTSVNLSIRPFFGTHLVHFKLLPTRPSEIFEILDFIDPLLDALIIFKSNIYLRLSYL